MLASSYVNIVLDNASVDTAEAAGILPETTVSVGTLTIYSETMGPPSLKIQFTESTNVRIATINGGAHPYTGISFIISQDDLGTGRVTVSFNQNGTTQNYYQQYAYNNNYSSINENMFILPTTDIGYIYLQLYDKNRKVAIEEATCTFNGNQYTTTPIYLAQRNTGPKLLTVKQIRNGYVLPVENAYYYDLNESQKVTLGHA